ncbi:CLUMA_CG020315, isoform A [Clunio marinus]|uniref:CLUMA_CG020315, isoform A n=1 Tax=Clunio marinus TaxID=568069 RepID=A0A1J1J4K8_9DIPT|nr:CLUMA_CG020315, isoform A [Clunio marinus]
MRFFKLLLHSLLKCKCCLKLYGRVDSFKFNKLIYPFRFLTVKKLELKRRIIGNVVEMIQLTQVKHLLLNLILTLLIFISKLYVSSLPLIFTHHQTIRVSFLRNIYP